MNNIINIDFRKRVLVSTAVETFVEHHSREPSKLDMFDHYDYMVNSHQHEIQTCDASLEYIDVDDDGEFFIVNDSGERGAE